MLMLMLIKIRGRNIDIAAANIAPANYLMRDSTKIISQQANSMHL